MITVEQVMETAKTLTDNMEYDKATALYLSVVNRLPDTGYAKEAADKIAALKVYTTDFTNVFEELGLPVEKG